MNGFKTRAKSSVAGLDRAKLLFDIAFYALGTLAFYRSFAGALIVCAIALSSALFGKRYRKSLDGFYFDNFIDFLNMIHSGLSSGQSIDAAISGAAAASIERGGYALETAVVLDRAIRLGINGEELFDEIRKRFPIEESVLFTRMMALSRKTGSSMSRITEVTLDKLYTRYRAVSEAELIIYQKKLEQRILCIAPILVIFFIQYTQGAFLDPMYTRTEGIAVMSFSFGLLAVMKAAGELVIRSVG